MMEYHRMNKHNKNWNREEKIRKNKETKIINKNLKILRDKDKYKVTENQQANQNIKIQS